MEEERNVVTDGIRSEFAMASLTNPTLWHQNPSSPQARLPSLPPSLPPSTCFPFSATRSPTYVPSFSHAPRRQLSPLIPANTSAAECRHSSRLNSLVIFFLSSHCRRAHP